MDRLPANVYSVAAVREMDRTTIEDHGVPGYTLMTRAGEAAFDAALVRFRSAAHWQIVCGAGNNGGDGYVLARLAGERGIAVSVVSLVDPARLAGDAARACDDYVAAGGEVEPWAGDLDAGAGLLVDAILGSGLEREVGGEFADAVEAINAHEASVLALDIPTGIHGDSGAVLGCAVRADLTITFVGLKTGLFLGEAPDYCGELCFAGLDIPAGFVASIAPALRRVDDAMLAQALPRRQRTGHKGDYGHVLIIGGGEGMPGAVRLAGEAALRTGSGLVSIATHPAHAAMLVASRPELMPHGVATPAQLEPLLERADVVAFGPGLGRSDWAEALFDCVATLSLPAVWDADALNLLADRPAAMQQRVITPHPGEAARLLGTTAAAVQADRPGALNGLAQAYGGTVVLKGAGSLVSTHQVPYLCLSGNPGMGSAGMGDVLTGIIASLIGQGVPVGDAAAVGVEVHARAGDRAATSGERGLVASDLLGELRRVVNP
ncbi:MAG: NAD(P)H-hydrate dehydratase [Gammaproteobacteria bacterium]|nr:NAD(P)H-hydrate dehydratase [Gammaproteobacteria bacterium]